MDVLQLERLPVNEEGEIGISMSVLFRGPIVSDPKSHRLLYVKDGDVRYDLIFSKEDINLLSQIGSNDD
jgi:hypothetical protein